MLMDEDYEQDPCSSPLYQHILQTLLQYTGREMSARTINLVARQLAARRDALPHMPLMHLQYPVAEWAAFEILDAIPSLWRDREGHMLRLYTLTGKVAGLVYDKKLPDSWLRGLAYRIGYTRRFIYSDEPKDLVGLRLWADVAPSERDPKQPDFREMVVDAQLMKHNKDIIKKRMRFEREFEVDPCPYSLDNMCSECHKDASECNGSYTRRIDGSRTVPQESAAP